jgi:hypothetical protein
MKQVLIQFKDKGTGGLPDFLSQIVYGNMTIRVNQGDYVILTGSGLINCIEAEEIGRWLPND